MGSLSCVNVLSSSGPNSLSKICLVWTRDICVAGLPWALSPRAKLGGEFLVLFEGREVMIRCLEQ